MWSRILLVCAFFGCVAPISSHAAEGSADRPPPEAAREQPAPTEGVDLDNARLFDRKRLCRAQYMMGNHAIRWIDLGMVNGVNRKKECLELAQKRCQLARELLPKYAPVGSANFAAICGRDRFETVINTEVDGKKNSRDGSCSGSPQCTFRWDCPACPNGYWEENQNCVTKACRPVTPRPANNTSFVDETGYFFWDGELRHRVQRSCVKQWTGYR